MNKFFLNRTINLTLIITILWHLVIVHNVFQNYVICYGNDGHIKIENAYDCDNCSVWGNVDFSSVAGNIVLTNNDCEDTSLEKNCFDEDQFISRDKIDISESEIKSIFRIRSDRNNNLYIAINNEKTKNHILANYSTVSLLI